MKGRFVAATIALLIAVPMMLSLIGCDKMQDKNAGRDPSKDISAAERKDKQGIQ